MPLRPALHHKLVGGYTLLGALRQLLGNGPLALLQLVLGLGAQDVASPLDAGAVVELGLEGVNQLGKLSLVLLRSPRQMGSESSGQRAAACAGSR